LIELVLATRNSGKITEIKHSLKALDVRILTFEDIKGLPIVQEDGGSFYENACKKATVFSSSTHKIALADDSGLEVAFLNNKPGIFSARFSGMNATYADNNTKLLRLLKGIEEEKRTARFRCVMVLAFTDGSIKKFEGVLNGRITTSEEGSHGFGYDPIFFAPELGKTLAELSIDEKNKISHRGEALRKVYQFLEKHIIGSSER